MVTIPALEVEARVCSSFRKTLYDPFSFHEAEYIEKICWLGYKHVHVPGSFQGHQKVLLKILDGSS